MYSEANIQEHGRAYVFRNVEVSQQSDMYAKFVGVADEKRIVWFHYLGSVVKVLGNNDLS